MKYPTTLFEPFSSQAPLSVRPETVGIYEGGRKASGFKFEPFSSQAPLSVRPETVGIYEAGCKASGFKTGDIDLCSAGFRTSRASWILEGRIPVL